MAIHPLGEAILVTGEKIGSLLVPSDPCFGHEEWEAHGAWALPGAATHWQDAVATNMDGGMPKHVANRNKSSARLLHLVDAD